MRNHPFLCTGSSPKYLKKIGTNFFVAAGILAFLASINLTKINLRHAILAIVFFTLGALSFGLSHLKMKYYKKEWKEIGEPEMEPKQLRRSARHFAQFGLVIVFFIIFKSFYLMVLPGKFDVVAMVVPFLICLYLLYEAKRRK